MLLLAAGYMDVVIISSPEHVSGGRGPLLLGPKRPGDSCCRLTACGTKQYSAVT